MFRWIISLLMRMLQWRRKQKFHIISIGILLAGFLYIYILIMQNYPWANGGTSYIRHKDLNLLMAKHQKRRELNQSNYANTHVFTTTTNNIATTTTSNIKTLMKSQKNNDIPKILYKMIPLVDKNNYSNEYIYRIIRKNYNNIPFQYLENKQFWTEVNGSCGKYPELLNINYNNIHWQYLKTKNGSYVYVFSAFYDNRNHLHNTPVVRILSMINTLKPYVKPYCQFWFKDIKKPISAKVSSYNHIWKKSWCNYKEGILQPYILTCDIPKFWLEHRIPESVSLVEKSCDNAKTNIRVINNPPPSGIKKDIAVCVKGIDLLRVDHSVRIVEWLELLSLLGVNKVIMYELGVHPNISKVLRYYKTTGFIDLIPLSLPGNQPNVDDFRHKYLKEKIVTKRQNEVIPYNDCFYRNMYLYRYIALLDTDEIIMPRKNIATWTELINVLMSKANDTNKFSSFLFRHVYAMPSMTESHGYSTDVPIYMHMLRNTYRSVNYTKPGEYIKAFHNTDRILTLHNHFPLACIGGACSSYSVDISIAHLLHYREDCVGELKKTCSQFTNFTVEDKDIWRYKDKLIKNTFKVLFKLGFFDYTVDLPFKVLWDLGMFNHQIELPITRST